MTFPASTDREILRLAVPAFAALVSEPLFLLADAAIVGHLGTTQLGAQSGASEKVNVRRLAIGIVRSSSPVNPIDLIFAADCSSRSASCLASAGPNASDNEAGVGVQVVLHEHDGLGVGGVDVQQLPDGSAPSRCGCAGR